jgi:CDP-diacylglycerol--serine O-phosphatidyltransferase
MGWCVALFYTTCVALRLARFNVQSQDDGPAWRRAYFTGVPSTAGGCLAMLPIMYENAAHTSINHCPWIFALTLVVVGVLMVSRLPILTMKNVKITQRAALLIMLVSVLTVGVFYSYPWICLTIGGAGYLALIPISLKRFRVEAAQENSQE